MSDSDGAAGGCCRCCCSFIFTSGLTALFMWLSLRTSNPKCWIHEFYVPALNRTDNSNTTRNNHTIFLNLKLKNVMKDKNVIYSDVNVTVYYGPNTSLLIANYTLPGFKQGHEKKAFKKELIQTHGIPWDDIERAALNKSAIFRVDLATRVRFKIIFWKTKRYNFMVRANVTVDESGKKIDDKHDIRLKSGVAELKWWPLWVRLLIILNALALL